MMVYLKCMIEIKTEENSNHKVVKGKVLTCAKNGNVTGKVKLAIGKGRKSSKSIFKKRVFIFLEITYPLEREFVHVGRIH